MKQYKELIHFYVALYSLLILYASHNTLKFNATKNEIKKKRNSYDTSADSLPSISTFSLVYQNSFVRTSK